MNEAQIVDQHHHPVLDGGKQRIAADLAECPPFFHEPDDDMPLQHLAERLAGNCSARFMPPTSGDTTTTSSSAAYWAK